MGLHQRLHRGRQRQAGLRLDHHRPHLRHLHGAQDEAAGADRLHAGGPLLASRALPPQLEARRQLQRHLHRLGLSAEGLRQVGGTGLPVGEALRAEVRQGGGGVVAVGGVERAQYRLLERHAGGISQALRLRGRRREARAAHGARRRTGFHRPGQRQRRDVPAQLPGTRGARQELRHRQDRLAARFHQLPRQGLAQVRRRQRGDGDREPASRPRQGLRDHRLHAGTERPSHHHRGIRPRRLRRLLFARLSAERVPQRRHVLELHRRR